MLSLKKLAGGVAAAFALVYFGVTTIAGASTASPWLSSQALPFTKLVDVTAVPSATAYNSDCMFDSTNTCAYATNYGFANTRGAVQLNTADYLPVLSYMDNRQHFLAIPGSSEVITYTTDPVYGAYLYFNFNFTSTITHLNDSSGNYYQMKKVPDGKLTDKAGHRLAADLTSMSFSPNGQWMVVSAPNLAMLRVNLQTLEVLPFAPGFSYGIGLSPNPVTAITNDGRYAVIASKDFSRFSLYDLSTCGVAPDTINGPTSCQSRDLQAYMSSQLSGFSAPSGARFVSDDALTFYARYTQNGTAKISRFMLSTQAGPAHLLDYLALGDSYISGEGAFDYLPGTDTASNQCHVSANSYPLMMGKDLNFNSFKSIACSGATTNDITNTSNGYKGQASPHDSRVTINESARLSDIMAGFQQGYIDQLDFVRQYRPQAITLSVGGNDIGFSARLQQCLGLGTCYSTYEDRLEFVREVNRAFPKFANTYLKLKNAGPDDMRLYVIGYRRLPKPAATAL